MMITFFGLLFSTLVIWGTNPIYSILTLIISSASLGVILLWNGVEFISFLIVLIYIGAVTVLFLFVVMMINFKTHAYILKLPEMIWFWFVSVLNLFSFEFCSQTFSLSFFWGQKSNFWSFSFFLYEQHLLVGLASLILLVAMIGAICLTFISSENYRSQQIYTQTRRSSSLYSFYGRPL